MFMGKKVSLNPFRQTISICGATIQAHLSQRLGALGYTVDRSPINADRSDKDWLSIDTEEGEIKLDRHEFDVRTLSYSYYLKS